VACGTAARVVDVVTDLTIKPVLQDWAKVEDAKPTMVAASRSAAYAIWHWAKSQCTLPSVTKRGQKLFLQSVE